MKAKVDLGKELRQAYGDAPEAYRQEMRRACGQLEEAPRLKRISGLAVALALALVLAGAALAAHSLGTFDFLFPGREAPQEVQERLQSGFVQEGGGLETVSVTVRDAVTDGITACMSVEFQAKDPRDVLLGDYDPKAQEAPRDGRRHLVVWQNDTMGENLYLAGQDWKSVDEQTVLMHFVIDVARGPASGEAVALSFAPGVRVLDGQGQQQDLERGRVGVSIRREDMAQIRRQAQTPLQVPALGITLTQADITWTPLATYVSVTYQVEGSQEEQDEWQKRYGNLWFRLRDGEGKVYGLLTGGNKYSYDAAWPYQERVEQMYERMEELPQRVILVPYRSDTGEEGDPIILSLP